MVRKQTANSSIKQCIIDTLRNEKPETVSQLVEAVRGKYQLDEHEVTKTIMQLQIEGKIQLVEQKTSIPITFRKYLTSLKAAWYWITIALATATTLTVFTIPEDAYPIVYIRYVLGAIFVLWLPGYAFIKTLFPTQVPIKTSSENLDSVERLALSACMSIALVSITGLLLNYTPWGIRLTPITLSLLALTTIFATAAIIREHRLKQSDRVLQKLPSS